MKRLVVIDGMSVFYRGYFAMPGLSLSDGTPTGGVFGFASIAIEVIKKLNPDYVAVAWDIRGSSTSKRSAIYPEYKAGRTKPPEDFYAQMPILHELLDSFGWPLYELAEYEADDIMGTFATEASAKGIETCIVTGDYDMLQLISDTVSVYITKKGSDLIEFNDAAFNEKYGIRVDQFIDYKALIGDTSDNIPGVRKVGPKSAQKLLNDYGTLDGVYEHLDDLKGMVKINLEEDRDNAYLSRQLAGIYCDAPVQLDWDIADVNDTDLDRVSDILKRLEFTSLVRRLPKHMQQTADVGLHFETSHQVDVVEQPWPSELTFDGPAVLYLEDEVLWVSPNKNVVYRRDAQGVDVSVWRALEFGTVIAYDVKRLYHDLASRGVSSVKFGEVHDIRQGAFLIDPLRRDRSLAALADEEVDGPQTTVAALWKVYAWQQDAFEHSPRVADVARNLDFPVIYPLFLMEHRGIRIDSSLLATMSVELGNEHAKLEQEMYNMAGIEFNIASPAQLSEVLFTKLQLPTTGVKKGKTGYSTDQKTLDKLRGLHPIIELIERTRELAKLKNTYVDTLPQLADENGCIHTTYEQDVAATGRLSSNHPNLQNIPVRTEIGRRIREAFVPSDGKVFVSADYGQFELRLAAVLADDQQMINDFNSGIDIHTKTASDVYGIPLDKVTKDQRRDAKVINFGVLYGMSPHGLAAATGMTFGEAKQFIDQYFAVRAPIRRYIDATLQQARTDGYVETYYGRRRPTPDIHSSNFMVRQSAERAAANMPIQGTEADLMKRAMLVAEERLTGKAEQLLQVHDSILVECAPKDVDEVSAILKTSMESIAPELSINLDVDVSTGKNWGEL
ncbi:MAG TPA: DNA polymerase I [Candidatus Saccharibacteria bacterium]|nr:DNA polymerase I [Candidatus Saccharibacteria bacterium]